MDPHHRSPTPRSLKEAFGPNAQLHVERSRRRAWIWAVCVGLAAGIALYLAVALCAGPL